MIRRWPAACVAFGLWAGGCANPPISPEYAEVAGNLHTAAHHPPNSIRPDQPRAVALDPAPAPPELAGVHSVDDYIRHALAENRGVQAARANVLAMKNRIPQV